MTAAFSWTVTGDLYESYFAGVVGGAKTWVPYSSENGRFSPENFQQALLKEN